MSIAQRHKYTYEDYLNLPDQPRVELIDGEFVVSPSPNFEHQRISARIAWHLIQWVDEKRLGEVVSAPMDVILSKNRVVQPDVLYISNAKASIIRDGRVFGAPDLLVEILSPSREAYDRLEKKALYEKEGIKEYWIVDPKNQSVMILNLEGHKFKVNGTYSKGDNVTSTVIPGFQLSVSELFRSRKSS